MFRDTGKPPEGDVVGAAVSGDRPERRAWRGLVPRCPGFTLIELITVIGIMALMTVIAIPAFQSATKGSAVGIGAGHLVNTLTLARAKAVTSRSHVRVVFADGANTNATVFPKVSYALLMWTNQDLDPVLDNVPANWVYLDRWQSLPKGAFFSTLPSNLPTDTPFPSNRTTGVTLAGFQFNSAGALAGSAGNDVFIAVQEGVVKPDGSVFTKQSANTTSNRIYAATGRAKVIR